jgi:Flp pilus assembly pilin Flp
MRNKFKRFLAAEGGGAALEYALVSTLAVFASVAGVLALQSNESFFVPALHRKITEAMDQIKNSLR